jgi:hypothetical protein
MAGDEHDDAPRDGRLEVHRCRRDRALRGGGGTRAGVGRRWAWGAGGRGGGAVGERRRAAGVAGCWQGRRAAAAPWRNTPFCRGPGWRPAAGPTSHLVEGQAGELGHDRLRALALDALKREHALVLVQARQAGAVAAEEGVVVLQEGLAGGAGGAARRRARGPRRRPGRAARPRRAAGARARGAARAPRRRARHPCSSCRGRDRGSDPAGGRARGRGRWQARQGASAPARAAPPRAPLAWPICSGSDAMMAAGALGGRGAAGAQIRRARTGC